MALLLAFLGGFLLPASVEAQDPEPSSPWEVEFESSLRYMWGGIYYGFLQTPSGGEPASSTTTRPTLEELGIDTISATDVSLDFRLGDHLFTLGAQIIRADSNATLKQDLTSQAVFYPANTRVEADLELDWFRFGYGYRFDIPLEEAGEHRLLVTPSFEIVTWTFHYILEGDGGLKSDREYMKQGFRLGTGLEWVTGSRFSLACDVQLPIMSHGTVNIFDASLTARYRLWGERTGSGGSIEVGIGYTSLEYQDRQEMPNHIKVVMGPLLVGGIDLRF